MKHKFISQFYLTVKEPYEIFFGNYVTNVLIFASFVCTERLNATCALKLVNSVVNNIYFPLVS